MILMILNRSARYFPFNSNSLVTSSCDLEKILILADELSGDYGAGRPVSSLVTCASASKENLTTKPGKLIYEFSALLLKASHSF